MTAVPPELPAPQVRRIRFPDSRPLAYGIVIVATLYVFFIMAGAIQSFRPADTLPFFTVDWSFPALFSANTPTGGDSGAHVFLPAYLRDNLLPDLRVLGWSNDWYAGFPVMYFYFPLPALVTVLLDLVMPYGVAFKLVSVAGVVALPAAAYYLVRGLGFPRLVAAVASAMGTSFLFMESFSIFGANIKSTLAGEFSFSWSFALSLVYVGLVAKDTRERRGFRVAPAVVLALAALAHAVTTAIVVVAVIPLLFTSAGRRVVLPSWFLGFALSAFWAVPLIVRALGGFTTDMGWTPVRAIVGDTNPGSPFPDELIPVLALAVIGIVWTLIRRDDVVALATMTLTPLAGYLLLPATGETLVYNARLLPYWYFGLAVFGGLALGLGIVGLARWVPWRQHAAIAGSAAAAFVVVLVISIGMHDLPAWVRWNFTGYEGKEVFGEYETLLQTVDGLPPGRVMWEVNSDQNKYGTPMALMLLPYWTEEHASMEGVFFESSLTTPFHFLNASEVSHRPSNPVRGINYKPMNFARALDHLAMYNISYYISFTEEATTLARSTPGYEVVATPEPWTVFRLPPSDLVDIADNVPAVWAGEAGFLDAALEWYDDTTTLDHWLVEEGLDAWPQVSNFDFDVGGPIASGGEVSNVILEDHRIAFDTTAVGVPHMVKVSHFPNWKATGADGPFRAAPSLMVVVPTERHVEITFEGTWVERVGTLLTGGALLLIGGLIAYRRRASVDQGRGRR